jgi:hypothetical protein
MIFVLFFVVGHWSRIRIRNESVNQLYGSADPDPYQNVTDSQHWLPVPVKVGKTGPLGLHLKPLGPGRSSPLLIHLSIVGEII